MTRNVPVRRGTAAVAALASAIGLTVAGFALTGGAASAAVGAPAAAGAVRVVGAATTGPTTVQPNSTGPCTPVPSPSPVRPGTVVQTWDFEDGTSQGWSGSTGVTASATTDVAASGTHALSVHPLPQDGGSASATTRELPGSGWYSATALIRVPVGVYSASIGLLPTNVAESVPGRAYVTSTGWTQLTAWFRPYTVSAPGGCTGTAAPATLQVAISYPPCATPPPGPVISALYVDDVTVTTQTSGTPLPSGVTTVPPGCGTTSPPPPPATCQASYQIVTTWPGGYVASVHVRNVGTAAKPTWTLGWTFPTDQTVTTLWGGTVAQSGRTVRVTSPSWAPLPVNGTVEVGFVGSSGQAPVAPSTVSLDGAVCGVLTT